MAARTVLTCVGTHGPALLPGEWGGPAQDGAGAPRLEGGGSRRGSPGVGASFHLEAWQLSLHPTKEETDPGRDSYSPKTFHPPQAFSGRSVIQTRVSSLRLRVG